MIGHADSHASAPVVLSFLSGRSRYPQRRRNCIIHRCPLSAGTGDGVVHRTREAPFIHTAGGRIKNQHGTAGRTVTIPARLTAERCATIVARMCRRRRSWRVLTARGDAWRGPLLGAAAAMPARRSGAVQLYGGS